MLGPQRKIIKGEFEGLKEGRKPNELDYQKPILEPNGVEAPTVYPVLTEKRWSILRMLQSSGGRSAAELAEQLGVTEQAVAKHLDQLYRQRLISIDPNKGLAKPRMWILTPLGSAYLLFARVDDPGGANNIRYLVASDINGQGNVGNPTPVRGFRPISSNTASGMGMAAVQLDGGPVDIIFDVVDASLFADSHRYMVGYQLDANGWFS